MSCRLPLRTLLLLALTVACACQPSERKTRTTLLGRAHDGRPAGRIIALKELAKDPNREETTAIANSARGATEDVRREIATTLGASKQPEAIDLLGALLRDGSDSVRASAVRALSGKEGPRAAAYVAHAYEKGGPKTRAAISEGSPETFKKAVEREAAAWHSRLETESKDSRRQVQANARVESGREATPEVVAQLTAALADPDPVMAAAAAAGLVNAQAVSSVPALIQALKSPAPLVVQATAVALRSLGAHPALEPMVAAVESAREETAERLMDAIEGQPLTDTTRATLCRVATGHPEASIALRAARLVGPACALPTTLPASPQEAAPRLLVLAALDRKDAATLKRARALLEDADARVGAAAAAYLARCGEKSDATGLINKAQSQLVWLRRARTDKAAQAEAARQAGNNDPTPEQIKILQNFFGNDSMVETGKVTPEMNRLAEMVAKRRSSADIAPVEDRPGAVEFLAATAVAGAKLGGVTTELAESLLSSEEPSLRRLTVSLAEVAPGGNPALLDRLRTDADPEIRLEVLLLDLAAGRSGVFEDVAKNMNEFDVHGRVRIAAALPADKPEAKPLLLALLEGDDLAAQLAAQTLSRVAGPDVDEALIRTVGREGASNVSAIVALGSRPGAAVDAALVGAAVHPMPDLRAFALQALTDRKACGAVGKLAPLSVDFSGVVRKELRALESACPKH